MSDSAVVKVEPKKQEIQKVRTTDELPIQDAARMLMSSGLVKQQEDIGKLLCKLSFGRGLGLNDVASVNGLSIGPNGTLVLSAALQLALIKRSGKYRLEYKQRNEKICEIQVYEKVDGQWYSCGVPCKFSWDDAVKAGLASKATYKSYPVQMLTARCISDCYRTHCSDVTGVAVYTPEEIPESGHYTDPDTGEMVLEAEVQEKPKTKVIPTSVSGANTLEDLKQLVKDTNSDLSALMKTLNTKTEADLTQGGIDMLCNTLRAKQRATPK